MAITKIQVDDELDSVSLKAWEDIKITYIIFKTLKGISYLAFSDPDAICKRCRHNPIFYFDGCPHCGYTFLSRDILRQTS